MNGLLPSFLLTFRPTVELDSRVHGSKPGQAAILLPGARHHAPGNQHPVFIRGG